MPEPSKRPRPCDSCRKRKTKCVTEAGDADCVLCRFHKQQCTYEAAPQARKRATPSDANKTETATKRSKTIRTIPGTGVQEYDALSGATLLRRTLGLQNLHHSRYIGANDCLDASVLLSPPLDKDRIPATGGKPLRIRFVHPLHAFQINPDADTVGYGHESAIQDQIEAAVEGHGPQLVKLYFWIVHPSFPVLHKEVFLEKYSRTYREFSPPLLAAVYLLASGYWMYSNELVGAPKSDVTKLERLASESFRSTLKRPKLSTIQAALLLSQYNGTKSTAGELLTPRELTTYVVNLAFGLGLHLEPTEWDIPDWEIDLRRRLSWAVYIQGRWSALLYGGPSRFTEHDWLVSELALDDFYERGEDGRAANPEEQKGCMAFVHMATLSTILSDIMIQLLSARFQQRVNLAEHKLSLLMEQLKPLQLQLKEWFATLPESLKMESSATMKLSSVCYLRLAYLSVETCLHRLVVQTLTRSAVDDNLLGILRAAAKERFYNAVDFIQHLQAVHLASFWYFISAQCCTIIYHFGRLLERTATDPIERSAIAEKLEELKWAFKVNGEAGAGFMKEAQTLIEQSSRLVLVGLDDRSTNTSPIGLTDPDIYGRQPQLAVSSIPMETSSPSVWNSTVVDTHNDVHQESIDDWILDFDTNHDHWATYV
ncbi:Fungal specific transcription factor [Recurvomyces mirabilis]|uniref:Fungal specific transcription factor n=1 Tax=Recurvomyces mirabilis TaxID=574656 RepID=A0AAE0WHU9_9PEZI|nr:Fungal specific transcription factor [Recurvomyces mirabilis]KAK5159609.1 Fungal specific transcription factor [Recurvomyces mirabilis]